MQCAVRYPGCCETACQFDSVCLCDGIWLMVRVTEFEPPISVPALKYGNLPVIGVHVPPKVDPGEVFV